MALTPGTRLGPYDILSALGAGGMGEVYKARDTRLTRTVAIKVLPADVAGDPAARARFEREARAIATLSHPHICVVHDVGHQDGIDYLVMELLEGETLAERLARAKGPLPLDEVLSIGAATADALAKAHRAGIVHRDLKPANVMLTKSGPKLLDFGLAKLHGTASPVSLSHETAATTAGPGTAKGTILGTIHYMSPEQVEGREADTRTDIWALGALLYEMATGQRPFDGESAASVIGAILKDTPPALSTRQPLTPPAFERLVKKCLSKDPDARWQSAKDLHDELMWIHDSSGGAAAASAPAGVRRAARPWVVPAMAVVAAAALAIAAAQYLRETPLSLPPETRTEINTPITDQPTMFALSPDGRQIVFVAAGAGAGESRLWLRSLATTTTQALAGTEGARDAFWSPDSRAIGFFADDKLKRLDLTGGAPQVILTTTSQARGGTWSSEGVILIAATSVGPLVRLPASGGTPVAATTLNAQASHRYPFFLPDGRHFLFYAQGAPDTAGIYLGKLDTIETQRLTAADAAAVYLPARAGASPLREDGWLLWGRAGTLVAQRLNLDTRSLTGDLVTLADHVGVNPSLNVGPISASAGGMVAYRTGVGNRQLVWFDRAGRALAALGSPDQSALLNPSVSPDGRRVAVSRTVEGNQDIWLLEGPRTSRFTFDVALDRSPIWSPDGTTIAFGSTRKGSRDLYQQSASGAGTEELLVASPQNKAANDFSPGGRLLLYHSSDPQTHRDLWIVPLDGDRVPRVFLKTAFDESDGAFSPDGRWVAYQSNESGRMEVYIRPFSAPGAPGATGQWQVSTTGGSYPRWRRDGKELYYLNPAGAMMAAPMGLTGTAPSPGVPQQLFSTRIYGGGSDAGQTRHYDVTGDGRFLVNTVLDDQSTPITLVQNWQPPEAK